MHELDRLFIGDVEAVIAADEDAVDADQLDQFFQLVFTVGDCVVGKAFEVARRRFADGFAFRARVEAAIKAPADAGEGAAGVGQAEFQFGEGIEYATVDQV